MGAEIEVVPVRTPSEMARAYELRRLVFIEEQHVPEFIEKDDDDGRAFHALALIGGRPVGCGRFVEHDGEVKIGRMAVLRELRGRGIGRAILEFLMDEARRRGIRRAVLHAQVSAEGFYLKAGFARVGEVFGEAGIDHRRMERPL
jgi:predicted GNAT family N-acyltransferase